VVRKIAAANSIITTVAGVGPQGAHPPGIGDGGLATLALLAQPQGLAVDSAGNLFIADSGNSAVREVTANNRIINTIAGGGNCSHLGGDGGPALDANLCYPNGLVIDTAGDLYVADQFYERVREITAPAAPPKAATASPVLSLAAGTYPGAQRLTITAVAGAEVYITLDGSTPTTSGEGYYTPIAIAGQVTVNAIALEPGHSPSLPVSATYNVSAPAAAIITTVAGSGTFTVPGSGGPALSASFGYLYDVKSDSAGNLYFADPENGVVWKLTASTKTVSVFAGTPGITASYFHSEGAPAIGAILDEPEFVAVDSAGNVFISDLGSGRVYKVTAKTGIITTYAGGGPNASLPTLGDGGLATDADLFETLGIAFDKSDNLYIADAGVGRIRQVKKATGIITSVAGATSETSATALGDGGPATKALLNYPVGIALDNSGNLYIVDRGNARIRKVTASGGIISTVAGTGVLGFSSEGVPATSASIGPWGIAVNAAGTIYFSNVDNTVREFVPGGKISTIAGTGYYGFAGDRGPARMGELCGVAGLGLDKVGSLYIADGCNDRVRKVSFSETADASVF
jgi:sugar lactone lactonase YvrE